MLCVACWFLCVHFKCVSLFGSHGVVVLKPRHLPGAQKQVKLPQSWQQFGPYPRKTAGPQAQVIRSFSPLLTIPNSTSLLTYWEFIFQACISINACSLYCNSIYQRRMVTVAYSQEMANFLLIVSVVCNLDAAPRTGTVL